MQANLLDYNFWQVLLLISGFALNYNVVIHAEASMLGLIHHNLQWRPL